MLAVTALVPPAEPPPGPIARWDPQSVCTSYPRTSTTTAAPQAAGCDVICESKLCAPCFQNRSTNQSSRLPAPCASGGM
jgi:hypothetical protein